MSASPDSLGIQHLTVVPTNFDSATTDQSQVRGDTDHSNDTGQS